MRIDVYFDYFFYVQQLCIKKGKFEVIMVTSFTGFSSTAFRFLPCSRFMLSLLVNVLLTADHTLLIVCGSFHYFFFVAGTKKVN